MSRDVRWVSPRRTHSDASTSIDCAISASCGRTPIRAWNRIPFNVTTSLIEDRVLAIESLPQAADEFEYRFNAVFRGADERAADDDAVSEATHCARLLGRGDPEADANRQRRGRAQSQNTLRQR